MRSKTRLVVVAAVLTQLWGCSSVPDAVNPVSWYRDVTGASKNDDLGKGQNEQNLQEGNNEPFPNLGNVPAAPDTAMSTVDRDKLVDSLIADRNNAKYASDDLHAGRSTSNVPPPPPPAPPPPPTPAPSATSAQTPAPSTAAPPASPVPETAPTASAAPPPAPAAAPSAVTSAPPAASAEPAVPAATQQKRRVAARGSEAPPGESSLRSPSVSSLPQGEAVTPAPPPPQIPPPNAAASTASAGAVIHLKPPSEPAKETTAAASGTNEKLRRPAISYHVADLSFSPGSALLSSKLRDTIATIVKLHHENGGTIRVVGHGQAAGANAAVTGFNLALDRAQAVAVALSEGGVSTKDIAIEAAPVSARGGRDVPRAEVYLEN